MAVQEAGPDPGRLADGLAYRRVTRCGYGYGKPARHSGLACFSQASDRAGHASAADPAVALGILRQVLLVIRLGEVHRRGFFDFRGDLTQAGLAQLLLIGLGTGFGRRQLLRRGGVDHRAVLAADVVALAHTLLV